MDERPPPQRISISNIAWGVFWGLTLWTVIAFFASLLLIAATTS